MDWIDLTQIIGPGMPGVALSEAKNLERDGWNAVNLEIYSHAGTHMDAPIHFGVEGPTIDQMPLESLFGVAKVLDLTGIAPSARITIADLGHLEEHLNSGDSLVIKTGWSKFSRSDPGKYRNQLPRISEELANWLVEKKVKILAVEPPSVANVNDLQEVTLIHRILFSGQVIIVEGICNLDEIQVDAVELMVMPLKIAGGDGAPARVLARPI
ncbi:Kynurenine formamidase [Cyclobacterium xiamenense]|uniref:Kynurenine formamidase n=1 Tax=Cyclobacterium xiamenense TaxID=1297121 RepID=A0A1H7A8W4_9BACT|nr:cyclase family protein [Cyclobacterium xiamenense]SEJ60904.1 Kynurenine formamidase [Cyclobacterium xiamenense]